MGDPDTAVDGELNVLLPPPLLFALPPPLLEVDTAPPLPPPDGL